MSDGTKLPLGACTHPRREDVRDGAGRRVAIRCAVCTEILRYPGSCPCGSDGRPAWHGYCSEQCEKNAERAAEKAKRARRADFAARMQTLPGVELDPPKPASEMHRGK